MPKKYCNSCGNEIYENDKFCGKCGSSLLDGSSNQDGVVLNEMTEDTSTKELIFSIIILVLLVGAFVTMFVVPSIASGMLFFSLVLSVAGVVNFKENWIFKLFLILSIVFTIVLIAYYIFVFYFVARTCNSCWLTCTGTSI